jgi:excisionase family DNA binding protein
VRANKTAYRLRARHSSIVARLRRGGRCVLMSPIDALEASDPRVVMTVGEACFMLRVGRSRLYDLIQTKQIESCLDGRSRRIWAWSVYGRLRILHR